MSAFLVDPEHVHVMLWAAIQPDRYGAPLRWWRGATRQLDDGDQPDRVGQMLVDENNASINYRYSENGDGYVYRYRHPRHTEWSVLELLNAVRCYEYQACEAPGWHESEAQAFCRALESRLVTELPGYHDGPWEITGRSVPAAVRRRDRLTHRRRR